MKRRLHWKKREEEREKAWKEFDDALSGLEEAVRHFVKQSNLIDSASSTQSYVKFAFSERGWNRAGAERVREWSALLSAAEFRIETFDDDEIIEPECLN